MNRLVMDNIINHKDVVNSRSKLLNAYYAIASGFINEPLMSLPIRTINQFEKEIISLNWGSIKNSAEKMDKMRQKLTHTYDVTLIGLNYLTADKKIIYSPRFIIKSLCALLLHDYGRIQEIFDTNAFNANFGHADLGERLLFGNNSHHIREFIPLPEWNKSIQYAIKFHDKKDLAQEAKKYGFSLDSEDYYLFRLVRTADKESIFKFLLHEKVLLTCGATEEELSLSTCHIQAFYDLLNKKCLDRTSDIYQNSAFAVFLAHIGFIFDYSNLPQLYVFLQKTKWIDHYIDLIDYKIPEVKELMEEIRISTNKFVDLKVKLYLSNK